MYADKTLVLTQAESDKFGNPRFVMPHQALISPILDADVPVKERYNLALKRAKAFGGARYRSKSYRLGIVFSGYDIGDILSEVNFHRTAEEQYTSVDY